MKAIQDLNHEHEAILRIISVLEALTDDLRLGPSSVTHDLREAIRFVRGFSDECHHGKEEKLLFPLIAGKNEALSNMPIRILRSEHDAGRTLIEELEEAVNGIEAGDAEAATRAARAIALYTRMLRKHIEKEENIVFPLAQMLISQEEADRLAEQFDEVEEEMGPNAHETFEAILESLEARRQTVPRLNAGWHMQHPMPSHPTLDQRITWHLEHQKQCACRQMPAGIKAEIEKRSVGVTDSGVGRDTVR